MLLLGHPEDLHAAAGALDPKIDAILLLKGSTTNEIKTNLWISVISQVWTTQSGHSLFGRPFESGRLLAICCVLSSLIT